MAEKEFIERDKAIDACFDGWNNNAHDCAENIRSIRAADVRPVVKGFNKLKDYPTLFECSACGWECDDTMPGDTATYNFCPNCGARMEES